MSLGSCLVSNEPGGLKDALLQARIKGKSWKEIGEEFNFGSPSAARSAFKKITGITDFKIKGKELKALVDNDMLDTLKKTIPKKAPKAAQVASAPVNVAVTNTAAVAQGSAAYNPGVLNLIDQAKLKQLFVDSAEDALKMNHEIAVDALKKSFDDYDAVVKKYGIDKVEQAWAKMQQGNYWSNIVSSTGLDFSDLDAVFWRKQLIASQNFDMEKGIWDAYKAKPTSETAFKKVKEMVWDLKRAGATSEQIVTVTGVDDNVVKLILDDKWSVPAKGAKQYVGAPAPVSTSSAFTNQSVGQIIGESKGFADMTRAQADDWAARLGQTLTPDQKHYFQRYTGSSYRQWNIELRNGYPTATTQTAADHISAGMTTFDQNYRLRRGVGSDTFPGGLPKPGDSFLDKGFMSTSYGGNAAFGGTYELVIDAPAGIARGYPVHNVSVQGSGEREILLDRNQKFIIKGTEQLGYGRWRIFMEIVA